MIFLLNNRNTLAGVVSKKYYTTVSYVGILFYQGSGSSTTVGFGLIFLYARRISLIGQIFFLKLSICLIVLLIRPAGFSFASSSLPSGLPAGFSAISWFLSGAAGAGGLFILFYNRKTKHVNRKLILIWSVFIIIYKVIKWQYKSVISFFFFLYEHEWNVKYVLIVLITILLVFTYFFKTFILQKTYPIGVYNNKHSQWPFIYFYYCTHISYYTYSELSTYLFFISIVLLKHLPIYSLI